MEALRMRLRVPGMEKVSTVCEMCRILVFWSSVWVFLYGQVLHRANGQTRDEAENLLTKFVTMAQEVHQCCSYAYVLETEIFPHEVDTMPKFGTNIVRYARNDESIGRRDAAHYSQLLDERLSHHWNYNASELLVDGKLYHGGIEKPIDKSMFSSPHLHPWGLFTCGFVRQGRGETTPEALADWASNVVFMDAKTVKHGVIAYWRASNFYGFYKFDFHQDFGYMPVSVEYRWCDAEVGRGLETVEQWTKETRFFFRVDGVWKPVGNYWVPTQIRAEESFPRGDSLEVFKQRFYIANWTVGDPSFGEKDFSRARAQIEHPLAFKTYDFEVEKLIKSEFMTPIAFFEKLESQIREAVGKKK